MRGEQHLTKPPEYALVYRKGNSWASRGVVLKAIHTGRTFSRYGFSISRKVGNAVVRNKIKRWLREILRVTPLKAGHDIIIIVSPAAAATGYWDIRKEVENLLSRAHLLEVVEGPDSLAGASAGEDFKN